MIVSAPNSFFHLSISDHICFVFSKSYFLALKNLNHSTLNFRFIRALKSNQAIKKSYSCYNHKDIAQKYNMRVFDSALTNQNIAVYNQIMSD